MKFDANGTLLKQWGQETESESQLNKEYLSLPFLELFRVTITGEHYAIAFPGDSSGYKVFQKPKNSQDTTEFSRMLPNNNPQPVAV